MNAAQAAGEEPASIVGRVSVAAEDEEDDALACCAMTWSTRSALVWNARPQPVTVQFMSAMTLAFGLQRSFQMGIRAGENVLMGADLAVGPCRVWLARPLRVEHLPSRWR